MDQEFREEFRIMCHEDLDKACLNALSVLVLRHILEDNRYTEIKSVLSSIEINSPEMSKLKEIYEVVDNYDKRLINNLLELDNKLMLFINPIDSMQKEKKIEIKKWWE